MRWKIRIVDPQLEKQRVNAELRKLREQKQEYEDLLDSIFLYISWYWVTKQLTTRQKELFADAVDASSRRLEPEDPLVTDRWWRDDAGEWKKRAVLPSHRPPYKLDQGE